MNTLVDIVGRNAEERPHALAYALVRDGVTIVEQLTYGQLAAKARAVGALLQQHTAPGERVLLLCKQSLDFIAGFLGCALAGTIAVPAYPPRANRLFSRLSAIVADAQPRLALTSSDLLPRLTRFRATDQTWAEFPTLAIGAIAESAAATWQPVGANADSPAFLQYTSGSTSTPKGVIVSHHNLLANLTDLHTALHHTASSVMVSWLPLFHDMGLIYGALQPLFGAFPCYLMSPEAFVSRPLHWLQAIAHFRGTHSAAPNFAYDLCVNTISDEERATLDLSSWVFAGNAAEPIKRQTVEQFIARFSPQGFRRTAFCFCYGLAESTLDTTRATVGEAPHFLAVRGKALEHGTISEAAPTEEQVRWLADCGVPSVKMQVVIADPVTHYRLTADRVGEIWVQGPHVAQGYWQRPEATQDTFQARLTGEDTGPFLRTGDLGFLRNGHLFVTGRVKDLIIIRGQNYYPHDIETTVQRCSAFLRPDRGVAFSIDTDRGEQVVIVQELVRHPTGLDEEKLFGDIRQAVAETHGLEIAAIVLLRFSALPMTSSGKLQRNATREAFLTDTLTAVATWRRPPGPAPETRTGYTGSALSALSSLSALSALSSVSALSSLSVLPVFSTVRWLVERVATRLGLSADNVRVEEPLAWHGVDSLMATQLANDIEARFACPFDPTLFYDHPTIASVARYLTPREPSEAPAVAVHSLDVTNDPIAVIGLSCRFPGASDPVAFWQLLSEGQDAITDVPTEREELRAFFSSSAGANIPRRGGYLDAIDQFDPAFFHLSPREADLMDPQQRLFLEVAWEALENSGRAPDSWKGQAVGVFVGVSGSDYLSLLQRHHETLDPHAATGNAHCMVANRLSYLMDWHGPSMAIDTACSSSLVAVHYACASLRRGECALAVAGGVNILLDPHLTVAFHRAGMLAPDGRCKTFDHTANGYVRGEGCGVVVLKPLSAAQRDGDHVLALIRGSAMNQDGQSNGITAPNGKAQEAVLTAALHNAAISPALVSYVETHGTGTALGDPVEVRALRTVLRPREDNARSCVLGAVKTNIGHLEAAAGIAGLIKTILALQHRQLPPNLHYQQLNPYLTEHARKFVFTHPLMSWETIEGRRVAGVSAFGFGGTNVHLIVEEASRGGPPLALPLSTVERKVQPFQRQRCWYTQHEPDGARDGVNVSANHEAQAPHVPFSVTTSNGQIPGNPTPRLPVSVEAVLARLTAIVARLLRVEAAGLDAHERFLEMGADSIVLVNALHRIEEEFGVRVPVKQLFEETPTLFTLARFLAEQTEETVVRPPPIDLLDPPRAGGDLASGEEEQVAALLKQQNELLHTLLRQNQALHARFFTGTHPALPPVRSATLPLLSAQGSSPAPTLAPEKAEDSDSRQHPQQAHLDDLITRYTARTASSKRHVAESRSQLADNRASAGFRFSTKELVYPLIGDRGKGARVWDIDGNEYLDLAMGFGVNLFGHAPAFVVTALQEELEHGGPLGPVARHAKEVAERVCAVTGVERVGFCSTGTEAVMTALRLARTVTGRDKIVVFEGAYHGHADGVLAVARHTDGRNESMPLAPGIPHAAVADVLSLPYGDAQSLEMIRAHGTQLAAVLVEPVQSRHPDLQPKEFLHQLRHLTRDSGTALIFDEMITGFRLGPGGAQAYFEVRADLVTYGKIVGGGLPIGIVAGAARFLDALDGGHWHYHDDSYPAVETTFFAGTFNKNPLTMAAARAVLRYIQADGGKLYVTLNERTARLVTSLNDLFTREDVPIRVAHCGSLFRFVHDANLDVFLYHLIHKGLYIWEGRTCFLSTAHTDADVTTIVRLVEETIGEMRAGGFFSAKPTPSHAPPLSLPLPPLNASGSFPLSQAQQQLCMLARLHPAASLAYNESVVVRFATPPSETALRAALRVLVQRHDALRTVIDEERNEHRVLAEVEPDFSILNLKEEEKAEDVLASVTAQPFVFGQRPLFRAVLLRHPTEASDLILCAHHLVVDGGSLLLVLRELGTLLSDTTQTNVLSTSSAPTFQAFLARRRSVEWTSKEDGHLAFWLDQLAALPPALDLPTDRARPALRSFQGGAVDDELDPALVQALTVASRQHQTTLYMTLLAGYSLLLHRLSGQEDFLLGIPVTGRSTAEEQEVVGFCTHMLPIRSCYARGQTLQTYLAALRVSLLDIYDHQDLPFARLLESLHLPFEPSRSPLFSVTFNLDQGESLDGRLPATVTLIAPPVTYTKFDLSLNLTRLGSRYHMRLEYARDLFDETTARRFLQQYVMILRGLAETPERRLGEIAAFSADEERTWLIARNATQTPSLPYQDVVAWFESQARRSPSRLAVRYEEQGLSYAQLDRQATVLAQRLRHYGVGPEEPVGVCLSPAVDLPVALLGVLKAGAFYVPLDPEAPRARLAVIVADIGMRVIITHEAQESLCAGLGAQVIRPGPPPSPQESLAPVPAARLRHADQLAYTIYTSGSTGHPKGVSVSHRALANLLAAMAAEPGFHAEECLLSVTPLTFDIAGLEIFLPLVQGGTLLLVSSEVRRDGQHLAQALAESAVSMMQATPATWKLLFNAGWGGQPGLTILCGGEALSADLARALVRTGATVWNMYGPTETTIWSSVRRIVSEEQAVDLGLPIANTRLYVVDADLNPVPLGVFGELLIGGVGLARGYWRDAAQTATRFVPDPFATQAGVRLYRTGDRARYLADGRLEFAGRMDQQVKIHGHRIELEEVAGAIQQHGAVAEAVVLAVPDALGDHSLRAYVVPRADMTLTVTDLRTTVQAVLPSYMMPTRWHVLERMPLTTNGKINRRALAERNEEAAALGDEYRAPENQLEQALCRVWSEVLGRAQVGVNDNFFDLGGSSLALARVHLLAQRACQREFPLVECLKFPTVRTLAHTLAEQGKETTTDSADEALDEALDEARQRATLRRRTLASVAQR